MGGRASRSKGRGGEYEVRDMLIERGWDARRAVLSGMLAHEKGDVVGLPGYHIEVKRCEKLQLPMWTRQSESQAKEDETPLVVYRSSREPWRVSMPFDAFLDLVKSKGEICHGDDL